MSGGQKYNYRRALDRLGRLLHGKAVCFGLGPACAVTTQTDDDVKATVLQIESMGPALAPVSKNRDLTRVENASIDVCFGVHLHFTFPRHEACFK